MAVFKVWYHKFNLKIHFHYKSHSQFEIKFTFTMQNRKIAIKTQNWKQPTNIGIGLCAYLFVSRSEFNGGFPRRDIGTDKYHRAWRDWGAQSGIWIWFLFHTFIFILLIKAVFNNHHTSFLNRKKQYGINEKLLVGDEEHSHINCIDGGHLCTSFHNAHLVKEQSTNDYLLLNCCLGVGLAVINPNEIITTKLLSK